MTTCIPRVDGLSTEPLGLGRHKKEKNMVLDFVIPKVTATSFLGSQRLLVSGLYTLVKI